MFVVSKLRHSAGSSATIVAAFATHSGQHDGDDSVRTGSLTTATGCFEFAGSHVLTWQESAGAPRRVGLEITRRGKLYDLVATCDEADVFYGMGMDDPECDSAMLVSWWSGERRPAGIVKYTISADQQGTIDATYTSVMSEITGHNDVLPGKASGDTSGGFPGTYTILYQGPGETVFGPFEWEITERADVLDLGWTQQGTLAIRGFGFVDPWCSRSIIVNYWGASE